MLRLGFSEAQEGLIYQNYFLFYWEGHVTDALQGSNGSVPDQHDQREAEPSAGGQASEQNAHAEEDNDDASAAGPNDHDQFMAGLLAQGFHHEEVASAARVSTKTIQRRLTNPAFRALVSRERRQRLERITGKVSGVSLDAIDTLVDLLSSENPAHRLRAAVALLHMTARYNAEATGNELSDRVDELEAALAVVQEPNRQRAQ
jgi:hypothetical protein